MKALKIFVLLAIAVLIIWIDLPENLTLFYEIGGQKKSVVINPLSLHITSQGFKFNKDFTTRLGLDLRGGSHLVFEADTSRVNRSDLSDALNSARDIIERRVNFFGVAEPVVQTIKSGNIHRISVDLPGIGNVEEAVQLIGRTAQLSFKEEAATEEARVATVSPIFARLTHETGLTGKDIKKATVTFDGQTGKPQVALTFTAAGADLFAKVTERNVGKPLAIYLDQFILSAPVVQQAISGGSAVINGNFSVEEAKALAVSVNSGALPVPINLVEVRTIGPSLGSAEIKKSVVAGVIGLTMVLIFMVGYYGKLGVIAAMALLIYGALSFAFFRAVPVVLTLPGVAGFILSIGMAVDSNILIFERIKEERRRGQDFQTASRLGFGRAIDAIKDANITTLLVAFILFNPLNWEILPQFGMVRGFALTLAIGVATSLFTGVVITKRLINFFYKSTKA
ncbi:protein translocase subunit SecD [Candidatus Roizmanbacteria bacterium]|nr:protein translocase subunit SecD [Candidatus Roizmanbacteria bacterium]